MSETENITCISKIYEAFNRGDIGYIIEQLREDVRWTSHVEPVVPWSGDFKGKREVPKFFEAIGNSVDVLGFTPREAVAQGDTVVSVGEFACKVRSTGKSVRARWVFIWKLSQGRVQSYEQFHDPALAQAFH